MKRTWSRLAITVILLSVLAQACGSGGVVGKYVSKAFSPAHELTTVEIKNDGSFTFEGPYAVDYIKSEGTWRVETMERSGKEDKFLTLDGQFRVYHKDWKPYTQPVPPYTPLSPSPISFRFTLGNNRLFLYPGGEVFEKQ